MASIYANPLGQGETFAAYTNRILLDLTNQYPAEGAYIAARRGDVLRRLSLLIHRRYPNLVGGQVVYQNAANQAGAEQAKRVEADRLRRHQASSSSSSSSGPDLDENFKIGQQPAERRAIAAVMGIRDAGHAHHQGNFDDDQTRRQLIDNLFAVVQGADFRNQVAERVLKHYGYDPR